MQAYSTPMVQIIWIMGFVQKIYIAQIEAGLPSCLTSATLQSLWYPCIEDQRTRFLSVLSSSRPWQSIKYTDNLCYNYSFLVGNELNTAWIDKLLG